jgi:hypothetical protein
VAAQEVAQAAGPHLAQPLRGGMPDDVGLHPPASQSAVIAARLAEAPRVERGHRRHDAQCRHWATVIDDGGQRPAGEGRRLALQRDNRVPRVDPAALAQRER